MSENLDKAACTEQEYEAARAAGLLVISTADEIAIHKFAETIRREHLPTIEALRKAKIPYLVWWDHRDEEWAMSLAHLQQGGAA